MFRQISKFFDELEQQLYAKANRIGQLTYSSVTDEKNACQYTFSLKKDSLYPVVTVLETKDGILQPEQTYSFEDFLGSTVPAQKDEFVKHVKQFCDSINPSLFDSFLKHKTEATEDNKPCEPCGDSACQCNEGSQPASVPVTDAAKQDEYRKYTIEIPNEQDVVFEAKVVARVRSSMINLRRWEYVVLQTRKGTYIGLSIGDSIRANEQRRIEFKACENLRDLTGLFGFNPLAKQLYEILGINKETVRVIE